MCPTAQAFSRGAVMVLRKYVFSLRNDEKLRSAEALDPGNT